MGFVAGMAIAAALMAVALGVTVDDVAMGPPNPMPSGGPLSPDSPVIAVTATIRTAKGQPPIDPARVEVLVQGVRMTGGTRHYDPVTGQFSLNLTMADAMAIAPPAAAASAPKTVVVSVRDGDREVVGEYRVPEVLTEVFGVEHQVGYTDRRGRFVAVTQEDPAPPAPFQWHTQAGTSPAWETPLTLAVERRWPAPSLGSSGVRLTGSPDGRIDLMPYGKGATTWATWEPVHGTIVETHQMSLDERYYLGRARRGPDGLVTMSYAGHDATIVEWKPGGQRLSLVYDTNDVVADARGVVSVADDDGLVVDARDWKGRLRWRAFGEDLLPHIAENCREDIGSLTPLSDGSLLLLQAYSEGILKEAGDIRFLVAHLEGREGGIRYARTMNLAADDERSGELVAGTAVRFGARDLAVLTIARRGEPDFETVVLDIAEPTWRPIARISAPDTDASGIYGAVVAGDRLVVGTGDAIVVLRADDELYGPPPPP